MTMDTTSKILIRAAELIAERGWAQGVRVAHDGSACVLGALNKVATGQFDGSFVNYDLIIVQNRLEHAIYSPLYDGLAAWNDAPDRTAEEVIDTLIAAAYWEGDE
jgi:hypothetical protein